MNKNGFCTTSELSLARAEKIKEILVKSYGISPDRIETKGSMPGENLQNPNNFDDENNRRVFSVPINKGY